MMSEHVPTVSYFDIVQAYFTHVTGKLALFSARDMELLRRWRDHGATAGTVCRGIRDATLYMEEGDPPRDLYNCRIFIEPYVERARLRLLEDVMEPPPSPSRIHAARPTSRRRALDRLAEAGALADSEPIREVYRVFYRRVKGLSDELDAQQTLSALLDLEEELAQAFFAALPETLQRSVELRITREDAELLLGMSGEAQQRHVAARRRRLLMHEQGLITLIAV